MLDYGEDCFKRICHGDPSTRTFGGHKGFYDGQLPAVILSGVHIKQSPINLPKKVCHP